MPFSQISATANSPRSGVPVTATAGRSPLMRTGHMYFVNSAVLVGTSGGHSALIDVIHRPDPGMPWIRYGEPIEIPHDSAGKIALSAQAGFWMTRTLSGYSANGSAPSITTFFEL